MALTSQPPMFRLRTLGGAALLRGGKPLDSVGGQRKIIALLAILAVARDRGISRDRIASYLWSESDMERARGALKQALHVLRRRLGATDAILGTAELRLNAQFVSTDLDEYLTALEAGDYDRAVDIYGGPFLDGFHLPGAVEFEQWADRQRDELARRQGEALERLARAAAERAAHADAAAMWRRLQAQDPFNARAIVGVATALEAAGERAAALRAIQEFEALIREELGTEPESTVTALALRLRAAPAGPPLVVEDARRPADRDPVMESAPLHPGAAPGVPRTPRRTRRRITYLTFAAVLAAAALWMGAMRNGRNASSDALAPSPSVAVLPFANADGDTADDHFSDGLTDALIARLGNVQGLRVAARTSTFALKGKGLGAGAVADTLGVATVLEGTVRREGDRLKITAQLLDAADGSVLWARSYDRQLQDVFAVQEDMARAVAVALRGGTPGSGSSGNTSRPTADLEAYDAYLRGRYSWQLPPQERLRQSVIHHLRAVERDPEFALAHAGLAESYVNMAVYAHMPPKEALARAKVASERALELDPNLVEALSAHAYVLMSELDFSGAETDLRRAIAVNPSHAWAHHFMSLLLMMLGRPEDAASHNRIALTLDPLSLPANATRGIIQSQLGDRGAAIRELERSHALAPDFTLTSYYLGVNRAAEGSYEAALRLLQSASRQASDYPGLPGAVALVNQRLGRGAVADSIIAELERRDGDGRARTNLAFAQAALGRNDVAFSLMAYIQWDVPALIGVRADPLLAGLRSDPRYAELLRRVGRRD